jgi:hypothetical protein
MHTVQTIRASAAADPDGSRRIELMLTTDAPAERDEVIAFHVMTVPEARRLYNTLQDALTVIDARSL